MQDFELEVRQDPAHYMDFDLNATGRVMWGFSVVLFGWSMFNVSSSTLATINVYDGTDTSGKIIFPINLAANQSGRDWFGPNGILFKNGLYLNVTAQEVKGAVFFRHYRP